MLRTRTIVVLSFMGIAMAQEPFSPPLIGYVVDSGVRPIAGTPGAARVLPAIALDVPVDKITLAPGRDFGIARVQDGTSLALVRFGTQASTTGIAETCTTFDLVSFSRTGSSAAVYSNECGGIQVITGLPDKPQVVNRIDVTGVTSLALNSDGSAVAYSREADTVISTGNSWPVAATALAFAPDDSSLAIVDGPRKSISIASARLTVVATDLSEPAAVFFADQTTLLVGDGRNVRSLNTATSEMTSTECLCKSTVVEPTAMKQVFRITDLATGAVWLLQWGDESNRTVFVPVQSAESDQ